MKKSTVQKTVKVSAICKLTCIIMTIFQFTTLYAEEKTSVNLKKIEIITGEIPPYSYLENGEPKGLIVDIVRAMAPCAGHSVTFTFYPWARAVKMVREPAGGGTAAD